MVKQKARKIQDNMVESAHKIWLAGLGALAMGQEEGMKLFSSLVERGETFEKSGKEQVEKAKGAVTGVKTVAESYWETFEKTLDDRMTAVVHRLGVPTKDEIQTLTKKVDKLTSTIEKLQKKAAPARKPTAAAKTAK